MSVWAWLCFMNNKAVGHRTVILEKPSLRWNWWMASGRPLRSSNTQNTTVSDIPFVFDPKIGGKDVGTLGNGYLWCLAEGSVPKPEGASQSKWVVLAHAFAVSCRILYRSCSPARARTSSLHEIWVTGTQHNYTTNTNTTLVEALNFCFVGSGVWEENNWEQHFVEMCTTWAISAQSRQHVLRNQLVHCLRNWRPF